MATLPGGLAMRVPASICTRRSGARKVGRMHGAPEQLQGRSASARSSAAPLGRRQAAPTHVEASARALEQLRQTQTCNSTFLLLLI